MARWAEDPHPSFREMSKLKGKAGALLTSRGAESRTTTRTSTMGEKHPAGELFSVVCASNRPRRRRRSRRRLMIVAQGSGRR